MDIHEESLAELLDCEGPVEVAGMTFDPSAIVRELDPIAWRCMLADYNCGQVCEYECVEVDADDEEDDE